MIIYQFQPPKGYFVYDAENVEDKDARKQIAVIDRFEYFTEAEYLFPTIWYPQISDPLFSKEDNFVSIIEGRLLIEEFLNSKIVYRIHQVISSKEYPEILQISFKPEHVKEVTSSSEETLKQKHFFFDRQEAIDSTIDKLKQNIVLLARE